jgi:glucosamine-6-phosphate deaminase
MTSRSKLYDTLQVNVFPSRDEMGAAAANHVATIMRELHSHQEYVRVVFASAPSQNEFLECLTNIKGIEWSRVIGFHMDEYIGLSADSEQLFGKYLTDRLFSVVPMKEVHLLNAVALDPERECARYADLLRSHPVDIVCMGIGENGHIAFNDPPVADFDDPYMVKIIELDEPDRLQQLHDGGFASLAEIPTHAITLTVPQLMSARYLSIVAPTERKATAIRNSLIGPISTKVPASILRRHPQAKLFIDTAAAAKL